jgi:large subunit ribosomal protein L6
MSRIGRQPVDIPSGVQVNLKAQTVEVKGKLGALSQQFHPSIAIKREGNQIKVERPDDAPPRARCTV